MPDSSPARVRVAASADRAAVAGLSRAWAEEKAGQVIDDPDFDSVFAGWAEREESRRVTWLVDVDGADVGMLNMLVFERMPRPGDVASGRPTRWGYVANVYVDAGHRDRGLGRLLLDAAASYAERERFARIVLSPSERSVPLYTRAGFVPATSLLVKPLG
ncbi:GNAT family N-acetyltransferase [Nocardioides iriomotensis]|uniref:GNAT family N-acetyltransferase n=1 Tax=Nocardioides iriomotensis TaxID=715784 RepID=A0A4Q5J685_9ACTN|nr:GNAT family N-acetyltransferase [Nocardioides iriomotensis]RYU13095.1 GNAT family N-acetyltransferase [Nocardioides iriomotensis]